MSEPPEASPSAEPSASAEPERGLQTSAVRRAILRALLSGVAGSITCAVIGLAMGFAWGGVGNVAFQGFLGGLVLGAVGLFESVAWPPGTPTRRRLLLTSAAVWVMAGLLCLGALLESIYANGFVDGLDSVEARQELGIVLRDMGQDPALYLGVFGVLGLPFALGALARGCALCVPEQIAVATLGTSGPAVALLLFTELAPRTDSRFSCAVAVAAGVLLPLAAWLGDLVERRRWGTQVTQRERQRRLAWGVVVGLLVLGAPAAYAFGTAAVKAREAQARALANLAAEAESLTAAGHYEEALELCLRGHRDGLVHRYAYRLGWEWAESAWFTGGEPPPEWLLSQADTVAMFEGDPGLRWERARWRLRAGDPRGALADLDWLIETTGLTGDVHVLRAQAHLALGDLDAAAVDLASAEGRVVEFPERVPELRARLEEARARK